MLIMVLSGAARDSALAAPVADLALGAEGATVTLRLTEAGRHALGESGTALALDDVTGETDRPIRINVFLDKPDADRRTSTEDPHFLGYLQLMPTGPDGHRHVAASTEFDMAAAPIGAAGSLSISLIPIIGIDQAPTGITLKIGRISLVGGAEP
jgi:hypothetical protein